MNVNASKLITIQLTESEVEIVVAALTDREDGFMTHSRRSAVGSTTERVFVNHAIAARAVRLAVKYAAERANTAAAVNLFDLNKGSLTDAALTEALDSDIPEVVDLAKAEIDRRILGRL